MQFVSRGAGAGRAGLLLLTAALLLARSAGAQTYSVLHVFEGTEGRTPYAGLVLGTDGTFYGTTSAGGAHDSGTVFRITPAGALTTLHSFSGVDGAAPQAALVPGTDGNFYGTTQLGGANNVGTVFRITPSGALTSLHSFAWTDGDKPLGALVQGRDGNFYGTTSAGGANAKGNVFRITPAGVLTTLHSFAGSDGADPRAGLVQGADGDFYGTTYQGGTGNPGGNGYGTIFRMTPTGVLTTIHFFAGVDGWLPEASLVQGNDGNFYGTTGAQGTVFRLTPAGALTTLASFAGSDGLGPAAALLQATDGNFYGTAVWGGASGLGTVFETTPSGTTARVFSFPGNSGSLPRGALVQGADGNLYGTASGFGGGVVFRLTREPELFLPVVLDNVPGVAGSRYTTELTLASRATVPVQVELKYTASVGAGTGSVSASLAPGETRVIPNAISFLRGQGLAIPVDGASVGTLLARFAGASLCDGPFLGGRTYTTGGGGTFGVFYPAAATTTHGMTLVGLQQSATRRSNLALVNAGPAPVTVHVQLLGPMSEDLGALPDTSLPPYGWTQINAPLEGKAASGQAVVTRASPATETDALPFTAYAVLNDALTSDGSFIPPLVAGILPAGDGDLLVPVVLDAHGLGGSHFTTELTLTNFAAVTLPLTLVYTASLGSGSGEITVVLAPAEQKILPDAVAALRSGGLAIPDDGSNVAGSLLVLPAFGVPISAFAVGSRTSTPTAAGGTHGVFIPGWTLGDSAASVAFVNGLQQNASQRSNLALVNRGDWSDTIRLSVSYFDGIGAALGEPAAVVLAPGQWTQFNQPLAAFGAASGYARIEKTSGKSRFVAYGILNDAGTSDGSYIPMSF